MGRVAVVGAGPVGSVVAAVLASAGHPVAICEISDEVRESVRSDGITLRGARTLSVSPDSFGALHSGVEALADDPPEILFLCVKATALPLISSAIADFAPPETTIVSWQNGIDTERVLADTFPDERIVRAVVNYGVSGAPGGVRVSFEHPPHYLQELSPDGAERARTVAALLSTAGLETHRAENLVSMVWKKAILNASLNALCGLTGLNMEEATRDSYAWDLADNILKESIVVARANEIWLGSEFYRWAAQYMHTAGAHRPSMLLDLSAGRRTEIDFINGKIVEYGRQAGVPTPYNAAMVALVKAREKQLAKGVVS